MSETVERPAMMAIDTAARTNERDAVRAFYAPISRLALLPVWLALVLIGYAGMFWAWSLDRSRGRGSVRFKDQGD